MQTKEILQHLKIRQSAASLEFLQELITAYTSVVPWESISKIVKKTYCNDPADCVRSEDDFWVGSIEYGTGGTCYESNWAFYKLLQALGFDCYLTINKIVDKSSVHSAVVVKTGHSKYIADVGYPLYAPIPLVPNSIGHAHQKIMNYRSSHIGSNEYLIENLPHPKPYLYHLTDIPVSESDYLKVSIADYCETGLFLNRIIVRKVINEIPTRFDSEDLPYNIHQLKNGIKIKNSIPTESLISTLSDQFKLNTNLIQKAFVTLNIHSGNKLRQKELQFNNRQD